MLTANLPALKSALTIDTTHMGTAVYLGSQFLGLVETFPAWGVDRLDTLPADVSLSDDVYVAVGKVYKHLQEAITAVTANWLVNGIETAPDYF